MTALVPLAKALGLREGERAAVAALWEPPLSPGRVENLSHLWDQWMRWRVANGLSRYSIATEQEVRRMLHLHRDRWAAASMRHMTDAIAYGYRGLGLPVPDGALVAEYLAVTARVTSSAAKERPVDPVRPAAAQAMAAVSADRDEPWVLRRRTALLLGRLAQLDLRPLAALRPEHCRRYELGWRVSVGDEVLDVPTATAPELVECLDVIVAEYTNRPLLARDKKELRNLLKRWASRANCPIPLEPYIGAGIPEEDVDWLLLLADTHGLKRHRDRLAVLVNAALGRRGIDLGRLELSTTHFDDTSKCWTLVLPTQKNGDVDQPLYVGHVCSGDWEITCPACLLGWWCWVIGRLWPTYRGPVFPARFTLGGPTGRMSTKTITRVIGELWAASGGAPGKRITARSSRVGVATAAREAGQELPEIAELLNHKNLEHVARYIRRTAFMPQVRLRPPVDEAA